MPAAAHACRDGSQPSALPLCTRRRGPVPLLSIICLAAGTEGPGSGARLAARLRVRFSDGIYKTNVSRETFRIIVYKRRTAECRPYRRSERETAGRGTRPLRRKGIDIVIARAGTARGNPSPFSMCSNGNLNTPQFSIINFSFSIRLCGGWRAGDPGPCGGESGRQSAVPTGVDPARIPAKRPPPASRGRRPYCVSISQTA